MSSFATKMSTHGDYNELEIIKLEAEKNQMVIKIMFIIQPQYLSAICRIWASVLLIEILLKREGKKKRTKQDHLR